MNPTRRIARGSALAESHQQALRDMIAEHGLRGAAERVGVARQTVAVAAAGSTIHRGTQAVILRALAETEGAYP